MPPRRAIAISLNDTNYPDAARKLSKLPIDAFVPGRPIHFDSAHFDRTEICAIEGLLFLSMGVFHAEHPDRQLAMFLRGLQI